eukprot:3679740-Pleurochrysis_carterae.AAC.1
MTSSRQAWSPRRFILDSEPTDCKTCARHRSFWSWKPSRPDDPRPRQRALDGATISAYLGPSRAE